MSQAPDVNAQDGPSGYLCKFLCHEGEFLYINHPPPEGTTCDGLAPEICEIDGDEYECPPVTEGPDERVAMASLPANCGEYQYVRGNKSLRLVGGECGTGYGFLTSIAIKDLKKIAPDVDAIVKSVSKSKKVTQLRVQIPARKIVTKKASLAKKAAGTKKTASPAKAASPKKSVAVKASSKKKKA